MLRVERWLKAVLNHTPGGVDEAAREVAVWSNADLRTLRVDETVFAQLIRDPGLRRIKFPIINKAPRTELPYNDWQMRRLRVLACVAAGDLVGAMCLQLHAIDEIDDGLTRLAAIAKASRAAGDDNFVLRRGAVLHGDVAMSGTETLETPEQSSAGDGGRIRITLADGQELSFGNGAEHWEIARMLLDAVKPAPDEMTRRWYVATSAWMQSKERHDTDHLRHAIALFPNDADLLFLGACQQEIFAGASLQAFAKSAVLPPGYTVDIANESTSLRDAEGYFRRALAQNPKMAEARLRLGHVLLQRGKAGDAAAELRQAGAATDEPLLQYFSALFLGSAEEALGHFEIARDAYTRAARLQPFAQSPYLSLSALATRQGDRAGALKAIEPMFAMGRGDDPWWTYYLVQSRNVNTLFEHLGEMFPAAER